MRDFLGKDEIRDLLISFAKMQKLAQKDLRKDIKDYEAFGKEKTIADSMLVGVSNLGLNNLKKRLLYAKEILDKEILDNDIAENTNGGMLFVQHGMDYQNYDFIIEDSGYSPLNKKTFFDFIYAAFKAESYSKNITNPLFVEAEEKAKRESLNEAKNALQDIYATNALEEDVLGIRHPLHNIFTLYFPAVAVISSVSEFLDNELERRGDLEQGGEGK